MLCMVEGRVAASGHPLEVIRDEAVLEGYLGRG
jgi:ABC-type branched-subunit amino acid transport system ATPase component